MPGWKNCILKAKYLCQTSSALWTGHTLCRHKYWALFLRFLTDFLFPCSFCWGSRPYRPCAILLLRGLDLQCCFFDETGWQLHQFWGSVEFYSISWYCISLLVLGVLQVETFCCFGNSVSCRVLLLLMCKTSQEKAKLKALNAARCGWGSKIRILLLF